MNIEHKKRKEDILKHKHLHNFALVSFIVCALFANFLSTTPKIFSKSIENQEYYFYKFDKEKLLNKNIIKLSGDHPYSKGDIIQFENLEIAAKSFVVYDVKNDSLIFARDENEVLPLASLTKVATAITAMHLAKEEVDIVIKKSLMRKDESLDLGMKEGQKWKLQELLKYGLTISSNSAMDIIASTISSSNTEFVEEMNGYVKELGFLNFYFNSASGLDYDQTIGGKGSALEFAKLFAKSYELIPEVMSYTTNTKVDLTLNSEKLYQIPNTNKSAGNTVGLLASKTGFTDAAGGNLAIFFNQELGRPIVIVVLGSTYEGRFSDVKKLYNATLNYLD